MRCPECGKIVKQLLDCREYYDFFKKYNKETQMENMLICEECFNYITEEIQKLARK